MLELIGCKNIKIYWLFKNLKIIKNLYDSFRKVWLNTVTAYLGMFIVFNRCCKKMNLSLRFNSGQSWWTLRLVAHLVRLDYVWTIRGCCFCFVWTCESSMCTDMLKCCGGLVGGASRRTVQAPFSLLGRSNRAKLRDKETKY